jgi:hypothetical protein
MCLFPGRLNTNEDNENMLGYDLYSSALADILSEPSLSMPITVGLYAKWGSGKSFLLNKLRGMYVRLAFAVFSVTQEKSFDHGNVVRHWGGPFGRRQNIRPFTQ